jgi:ribonuclease HI
MADYILYTDGGCSCPQGPGGWAYIREDKRQGIINSKLSISGNCPSTTNNRMELMPIIEGLKAIPEGYSVKVISDSQYAVNGINEWMANWKKNGWKRKVQNKLKPLMNEDLWKELDILVSSRKVEAEWVKGHNRHEENEKCDKMCQAEIKKLKNTMLNNL